MGLPARTQWIGRIGREGGDVSRCSRVGSGEQRAERRGEAAGRSIERERGIFELFLRQSLAVGAAMGLSRLQQRLQRLHRRRMEEHGNEARRGNSR